MDEIFQINVTSLAKKAQVIKSAFDLTILREGEDGVSVDRLPLSEYYVFFNHPVKDQQIKAKVYKTSDGKWYDKNYSEEAELHTPEFGIQEINKDVKSLIDAYEGQLEKAEATYL